MKTATSSVRRPAAVLLCTALVWVSTLWVPGLAHASACTGGSGVTVVVDFGPYGGVQTGCAPDPTNGLSALSQAGFSVAMVTSQPGFVCRINGAPPAEDDACARTPPATAYWAYWQAAPGGRSWTYSGLGAASSQPVDGATEGWAFGDSGQPGVTPPVNTAAPPRPQAPATTSRPPPPATTSRPPPAPPPGAGTSAPGDADPAGSAPPTGSDSAAPPDGSSPGAPPAGSGTGAPPAGTTSSGPTQSSEGTGGSSGEPAAGSSTAGEGVVDLAGADTGSGTPWGILVTVLVAAAIGGGAYWQVRQRR